MITDHEENPTYNKKYSPNSEHTMLFRWRALDKQGALTAIQTGEGTVSVKKYEAALEEIKRLQRLLGQATADNALLKDAVENMQSKKWIAR